MYVSPFLFRRPVRGALAATAFAALLPLLPLLPLQAHGQVVPDTIRDDVIRVGEISVQAARPVTTAGGASALDVQLDSMRLPAAPTLEQVLRDLPLVRVRTNSRGEAQFSLRGSGSDARQVAVLVDGVPLSLTWDGRADLSVLPATAATSLTLIRGLPSVLHGPNVLGGVLEIGVAHQPGRWVAPRALELGGDVESTGAYSLAGSAAVPLRLGGGWLNARAGGGFRDRPGHALPAGVTQPAGASARLHGIHNTDLRHADAFAALRYAHDGGAWATLSGATFAAERGIAAELHSASPRFWRYPHVGRTVGMLSAGTGQRSSPFGGLAGLEASVGHDAGRSELVSYRAVDYAEVSGTEDGDDATLTLRLRGDHTLPRRGELRGALTYADIQRDEVTSGAAPQSYRQRLWSASAESVWSVAPPVGAAGRLRLSIGAALDGADTPESGDKPPLERLAAWGGRVGATLPARDGGLLVHAGLSRRSRFPSLRELYSGALGRFDPNPELRAERLVAAEVGLTKALSTGEFQIVGFYRSLDDAIERVMLADGRFRRVNAGEARSAGAELLLSRHFGSLALAGDLTLQRVQLYRDGVREDARPEYQPDVLGGLTARLALPFDLRAGMLARHTGRQQCVDPGAAGALELPASTRLDLDIARELSLARGGPFSRLEVRAAVDNVRDAAIYDQCGLPQPGRTFRLQLRVR